MAHRAFQPHLATPPRRATPPHLVSRRSKAAHVSCRWRDNVTQHRIGRWAFFFVLLSFGSGCDEKKAAPKPSAKVVATEKGPKPPQELYLPNEESSEYIVDLRSPEAHVAESVTFGPGATVGPQAGSGRCPSDMVDVAGAFCIDRFEVSLVDAKSGRDLSPHYPPDRGRTSSLFSLWSRKASASRMALGREIPVPTPPSFTLTEDFSPRAVSLRGRTPAGYLSRGLAETACRNAGKRLCVREEWVRACRGEGNTKFPYGDEYQQGTCNVHRQSHPASLLHGNSSENHLDPRLGLTYDDEGPLLLTTGDNTQCVSRFGTDAIYDMVGNLDEWIEEPEGSFVGGFYSRATREGCDASIDSHDPGYIDYSLGTRCCKDQH